MVQLGLLRVKADSAHPATPGGPAKQEAQTAEAAPGGSAAEAAMQLSTGDAALQQPAAAPAAAPAPEAATGAPVAEEPAPQPANGEQSLANGDVSGGAADGVAAASAADAAGQPGVAEGDAEDVDVDMDIDPTSGARVADAVGYRVVATRLIRRQHELTGRLAIIALNGHDCDAYRVCVALGKMASQSDE